MKVLVSSAYNNYCHYGPPFSDLAKISSPVIEDYCKSNNYDFIIKSLTEEEEMDRNASWWKLVNIAENLEKYDWGWSIDIDGLIMNHNIKIEDIIDNKYDILVAARDGKVENINGGSILYKNSYWTNLFLKKMLDCEEFRMKGFWEQSTLIKYWNENIMDCQNHIKLVNHRLINSFYHCWFKEQNFKMGDLFVHFVGSNNDYRYDTMKKFEKFIIRKDNSLGVNGIEVFWGDVPH